MGKYSEVFVAFDVAKKNHAVAIAEGGRTGEVRFLGDVENSPNPLGINDEVERRLSGAWARLSNPRLISVRVPLIRQTVDSLGSRVGGE